MPNQDYYTSHAAIQGRDKADVETAVTTIVEEKRQRKQRQRDLDIESQVRERLAAAQDLLAERPEVARMVLEEVHYILRDDADIDDVLSRRNGMLEERAEISTEEAAQVRARFRRQARMHDDSRRLPNIEQEYKTLAHVSRALGYYASLNEMTPYAPITMEQLDLAGVSSADNPTPVGRRRLPKGTKLDPEDASREIPHESCDHILCVALPRSGKDSTLTTIGMNLWRQHGYKYISVFDDGRMETPMIGIPNDDPGIRQNLDRFGQEPRAFDAEVFVPSTPGIPDKLPANFREFTIGIDTLTPHLILRLAGVRTTDATAEDRIEQALNKTLDGSGQVPELVARIQQLSKAQDKEIQWTEKKDVHTSGGGGSTRVESYAARYSMSRSKALEKAAARLSKLAGDGLITGADAETNIDMQAVVANQKQAAVLCANFMPPGMEGLKYTLIDLWLRLVFRVRDKNPRLPRVALEMRELKNIAPSKTGDVRYKDAIKGLRQTIFFLSTQGGSRRILMLGSTQKLNDVYKPVRTNMATKILLRLGEEEIDTLDRSYNFSWAQKETLTDFKIGMGMLIAGGEKTYPIEWRGAPCGLGLGDQHWLDRYGLARGARVLQSQSAAWPPSDGTSDEWWVHVPDADVRDIDTRPEMGDHYSEWFLLESDFPDGTTRDDVDRDLVEQTLSERQDYPTPSDIHLADIDWENYRKVSFTDEGASRNDRVRDVLGEHNLSIALWPWLLTQSDQWREASVRENATDVLEAVKEHNPTSFSKLEAHVDVSRQTISNYLKEDEPLEDCMEKDGKEYRLTDLGRQALKADWESVVDAVQVEEESPATEFDIDG